MKIGPVKSENHFLSIQMVKTRSDMVKMMVYNEFYQNIYKIFKIYKNKNWSAREPGSRHRAWELGRTGKYRKKRFFFIGRPGLRNFRFTDPRNTDPRNTDPQTGPTPEQAGTGQAVWIFI